MKTVLVPGELLSIAVEGIVSSAKAVWDKKLNKNQEDINKELFEKEIIGINGAEYNFDEKTLDFKHDTQIVFSVDITPLMDGLEEARIENRLLLLIFNTASGKLTIAIPLEDIFNPDNYYSKTDIDNKLIGKADKRDVYTKTETDNLLNEKANASNVYTKTETDNKLDNKSDKNNTYTKNEVDGKLDDKVDKETGKGLSSNDYTNKDKQKLAGLENYNDDQLQTEMRHAVFFGEYDSNSKKLKFKSKDNILLFEIDATAFIKDGMIESCRIENGNLIITFNTDSGKEPIILSLTDIFNPNNYYTKTQVDSELEQKADKNSTYTKTEVDTKLELKADASDIYTLSEVDSKLAIEANEILLFGGILTDSDIDVRQQSYSGSVDVANIFWSTDVDAFVYKYLSSPGAINPVYYMNFDGRNKYSDSSFEPYMGKLYLNINTEDYYYHIDGTEGLKIWGYTKTEIDNKLANKADKSNTYTKTEVESRLENKANVSDVYDKEWITRLLDMEANEILLFGGILTDNISVRDEKYDDSVQVENIYYSTVVDGFVYKYLPSPATPETQPIYYTNFDGRFKYSDLLLKPWEGKLYQDVNTEAYYYHLDSFTGLKMLGSNTYTKTEIDGKLNNKADKANTYTKDEVDALIGELYDCVEFADFTDVGTPLSQSWPEEVTGADVWYHESTNMFVYRHLEGLTEEQYTNWLNREDWSDSELLKPYYTKIYKCLANGKFYKFNGTILVEYIPKVYDPLNSVEFKGTVAVSSVQDSSVAGDVHVVWNTTTKQFVAYPVVSSEETVYYSNWATRTYYARGTSGDTTKENVIFKNTNNNGLYIYNGKDLISVYIPPTLATVATSGSYNDLSDKPNIPSSVNIVTIDTPTSPISLLPNTYTHISGALPNPVTFNLVPPSDVSIISEYSVWFASGVDPNITWTSPLLVRINTQKDFSIEANSYYEVNVLFDGTYFHLASLQEEGYAPTPNATN